MGERENSLHVLIKNNDQMLACGCESDTVYAGSVEV
jgi:hypothetical protein